MTTLTKKVGGVSVPMSAEEEAATLAEWAAADAESAEQAAIQAKQAYITAAQKLLDDTAKEYGYDSIFTASTYADEPSVPAFQADGQALRAWRSLVWGYAYQVETDIAGGAEAPTLEDFIAAAPAYVAPA